jgi:hypothetical protein
MVVKNDWKTVGTQWRHIIPTNMTNWNADGGIEKPELHTALLGTD